MSNIKLINASCADQEVDAIANAANKYLYSGSGICGEIFKRNGYTKLEEACSKIKTPLNDGDAVITLAFNMPNTKHIIHAIGPDFNRKDSKIEDLQSAYYNSLKVLKENELHSIAFPLISSGIYGGNLPNPVTISTQECINAYNKFIKEYSEYNINVLLCAYTEKEYLEAQLLFDKKDF
jgi:O-acetyl-ADP-ribose deacetylase (regulator of RNase III)